MATLKVYQESPNTLVKMKKGPGRPKKSESIIKDVKRGTKRLFNPEEKIAIVLEGLSGDKSIAAICRREGIAQSVYYSWSKAFMDAGKARLKMIPNLMQIAVLLPRCASRTVNLKKP